MHESLDGNLDSDIQVHEMEETFNKKNDILFCSFSCSQHLGDYFVFATIL